MGQIMIETNPDDAYQFSDQFNRELAGLGGPHWGAWWSVKGRILFKICGIFLVFCI